MIIDLVDQNKNYLLWKTRLGNKTLTDYVLDLVVSNVQCLRYGGVSAVGGMWLERFKSMKSQEQYCFLDFISRFYH